MSIKRGYEFENLMSRGQLIAGWCYLPLHYLVLPFLLSVLALYSPDKLTEADINLVYYLLGIAFVLVCMWGYLRRSFDVLLDRLVHCLLTILMAFGLYYILAYAVMLLFSLLVPGAANPNDQQVMDLAQVDYGAMKSIAIFLAPIVEEVLFRGVVFGTLRTRSRVLAYVFSILLFSVYHVWQYVAVYGDWFYFLYALQYVPVSFVLAWCYERSGSIWTPIFFHMLFNAMSFYLLNLMQSML